jgi:hypothetical protein
MLLFQSWSEFNKEQMLRTKWYNYFRKNYRDYRVPKNWLLGAKGAKIATEKQRP